MKYTSFPAWPGQDTATLGCWRLVQGRAMSLLADEGARLQAVNGGLWVTLNQVHQGPGNASGDIFLAPGQVLSVPARSHVVIEPWATCGPSDAHFDWVPMQKVRVANVSLQWQLGVIQPLADLRAGLSAVGAALRGLALGLGDFAAGLVAETVRAFGRGTGFRALMAVSSATKAQGRIS
jgi:hypothetical protein